MNGQDDQAERVYIALAFRPKKHKHFVVRRK